MKTPTTKNFDDFFASLQKIVDEFNISIHIDPKPKTAEASKCDTKFEEIRCAINRFNEKYNALTDEFNTDDEKLRDKISIVKCDIADLEKKLGKLVTNCGKRYSSYCDAISELSNEAREWFLENSRLTEDTVDDELQKEFEWYT